MRLDLGAVAASPVQGEEGEESGARGSLLLLPLLAALTLAFTNRDKLSPVASQVAGLWRQLMAAAPSAPTPAPTPVILSEELIVEPVTKRKAKPRKV